MYQSGDKIMAAGYTAKGDTFVAEVVTPVETTETPKQEHEVVLLENFFDELRRRVPLGE
jgi:hypothetical protein